MGNIKNIVILVLAFVVGSMVSCKTNAPDPDLESMGLHFFPLQAGDYKIYEVTDIQYSIFGENDTNIFQLKEIVADSFLNEHDEYTYILHRFTRQKNEIPWHLDSVWTTRRTSTQAVVAENNIPFVKLSFPIQENKKWDGNILNTLDTTLYEMVDLHLSYEIDKTVFNNTLTVIQNNVPDTIVRTDIRSEVYALNVGLIYKASTQLNFCTDPDCIGEQKIETSRIFTQKLIDYGNE